MFHAHCVCVVGKNYRLQDIQLSKNQRFQSADFRFQIEVICTLKFAIGNLTESMVENTGLEPVTSWLQTRRSPS
jgi:hypothetical protein